MASANTTVSTHASADTTVGILRWDLATRLPAGDVLLLAPDPSPWIAAVQRSCADVGAVRVWAPWARSAAAGRGWPAALRAPLNRRRLQNARGLPGGALADIVLTRLTAQRPRWQYPMLAQRRFLTSRAAAALLSRPHPFCTVIAPSLASTEVLVAARDQGLHTVLVEDWPDLAQLSIDLHSAARAHPEDPLLRRFRPPAPWIARQRTARLLADSVLLRGHYAHAAATCGTPLDSVVLPAMPNELRGVSDARTPRGDRPPRTQPVPRVLLAGGGSARGGAYEAEALLDALPRLRMCGRLGDAATNGLRQHSRFDSGVDWTRVDAVLAPAWVESYPPEVAAAYARGIPVVATPQACGAFAARGHRAIEPGDVSAMIAALDL